MSPLEQAWQGRSFLACVLWPVSLLMGGVVGLRRWLYRLKILPSKKASVPVVVVGNISVGGTGKSPLTAALVENFQEMDWRPGIVARGYGGSNIKTPQNVVATSNPSEVGDEPVMLAKMTGVPVFVCANRSAAVQAIVDEHNVNIVFSDDGLQHYAMARDAELVVVDEAQGFGNGWLLPAGPLREPISRLQRVCVVALHRSADAAQFASQSTSQSTSQSAAQSASLPWAKSKVFSDVPTGHFQLMQTHVCKVYDKVARDESGNAHSNVIEEHLSVLSGRKVHAVAGIGNPARFFHQLTLAGIQVIEHPKPDHHVWSVSDLQFDDEHPIVITSKDAVKVQALLNGFTGGVDIYEVCVKAVLSPDLSNAIATVEDELHRTYRQPQQGIR